MVLDLATAGAAISALSSLVGLADKVADSWIEFKTSRKISSQPSDSHGEKIAATHNNTALVHSLNGVASKTVTRDELSKHLDKTDLDHLEALEKRMKILTKQWNDITRGIELETNLQNKSTYEMQLDEIKDKIGDILQQVFRFLDTLGFQLQDHYGAMRSIART